ncbi:hypothetical protein OCT51_06910 [Halomonas sp. LR3S48]|uniref:hypothetical protein n=1 Tax=Halomonas sp. LR3S48 TaxID=2982694 RepID=UPI0021E48314|nr:hypothetical protein [Halomonas sp. LR3S48]UYG05091.1 hypothetical protein OCT51_06910 [Halomonas sp. LR3S48]
MKRSMITKVTWAGLWLGASMAMSASAMAHSANNAAEVNDVTAMIEAIRAATQRFEDVNVALAEGYVPDPSGQCVSAAAEGFPAELGDMGIHYLRPDLLGITTVEPRVDGNGIHLDFHTPSILLYEPQADGSMLLVGVENLVFQKAWEAAGNSEPPVFAGRPWDHMADDPSTASDEAHGFEPHYDQHVWFRTNAVPHLEPFNPLVNCALFAG